MLPKASQSQQAATASSKLGQSSFEIPHRPLTDPARVPRSVSWRGSGADARLPADQANCGSCWVRSFSGIRGAASNRALAVPWLCDGGSVCCKLEARVPILSSCILRDPGIVAHPAPA